MSKDSPKTNLLITAPIMEHQVIKSLDQINENQNFLLIYIDEIEFSAPFLSGIKKDI